MFYSRTLITLWAFADLVFEISIQKDFCKNTCSLSDSEDPRFMRLIVELSDFDYFTFEINLNYKKQKQNNFQTSNGHADMNMFMN